MEITITCCDIWNPQCSTRTLNGRGYAEGTKGNPRLEVGEGGIQDGNYSNLS
jgi:hypothetical protein